VTSIDLVEIPGSGLLSTSLIRALTQHGQSGSARDGDCPPWRPVRPRRGAAGRCV